MAKIELYEYIVSTSFALHITELTNETVKMSIKVLVLKTKNRLCFFTS